VAAAPVSWLDWLIGRIRAAPGPSWAAYLAIFAALALLGHGASWLGGAVAPRTLNPLVVVQASFPVIALAFVEALNSVAIRSLRTLRPAMSVGDAEVGDVALDLVRTPRGWAVGAGLAGVAFAVASIVGGPENYGLRAGVGPIMWLWALVYAAVASAIAYAVVAHVVHQVGIVVRVHRELVRVDLFRLDPLYAFANLTSWTGISIVGALAYGVASLILVGGVRFSIVALAAFTAVIPVAVAVFVFPLLGLHGRIQAEKERRRAEAGEALETAVAELHLRIRSGDFERMSQLHDALAAATSAHATVSKISTWPWRPETLRGFISAVGLPILIWTITALLARVI
jgi:hypothetical protein